MFAVLHSDINFHKSGLLYLTGQLYCKKSRSAKAKDGIISLFLRNYLFDRYNYVDQMSVDQMSHWLLIKWFQDKRHYSKVSFGIA
jgi:hypothetical protein